MILVDAQIEYCYCLSIRYYV